MAMAEPREWQHDHGADSAEERLRAAEEQRLQIEGRCFAAERRRLDAERRLEQVEGLLEEARAAGERTCKLVVELIALAAQLRASIDRTPAPAALAEGDTAAVERAQMADALAAAVERLRARVAEVKAVERGVPTAAAPSAPPVPTAARIASEAREPHKHSMSAIARWRKKRKQRQRG
jgi:hypothetical protein